MDDLGMGEDILVSKFMGENCLNLPLLTSGDVMTIWNLISYDYLEFD